ncbi:MAG: cytochrome d ubiquinol oxidase subunit II [Candidatus Dormibacteraceae bacterium]
MNAIVDDAVAGVLLLTVAAYSTAGGTDYGAGIWDLLAGRFRHTGEVRALIDQAMAPVWEANNVWLVFAAVVCWTGFPLLFQSVFLSLYPLFALALLGLILRGAFFAFRKVVTSPSSKVLASRVFGISSLLAPFSFSAALGAIASGKVGAGSPVVPVWEACLDPLAIAFGLVAIAATAFSGASFLVGDARRYQGQGAAEASLVDYFRLRAVVAASALLLVSLVVLVMIADENPSLFSGMVAGPGLPFAVAAVVAVVAVAALMWRRTYRWFRVLTVIGVGSFVFAWGFGQVPYLLPGRLTIQQAAGAPETEGFVLVLTVVALALVIPSLALLYSLDQRSALES